MGTIAKIIVLLLMVTAGGLWLNTSLRGLAASPSVAFSAPTIEIQKPSTNYTSGYVTFEGTAIMDVSKGTPAVPYISYQTPEGSTITKQLIFADSRGCYPTAGDLPCAPSASNYTYPVLTTGQRVTVSGYLLENRLLVDSVTTSR